MQIRRQIGCIGLQATFLRGVLALHSIKTSPTIARPLFASRTLYADDVLVKDTGSHEPQILPARQPLHSAFADDSSGGMPCKQDFSVLSWNILLPNSQDNWWCHKMFAPWVPMEKREWLHRQALIRDRLLLAGADIVCIQEADGETFERDFAFMEEAGYEHCLHRKFRFRCATFFRKDKFALEQVAHKDRTLVTELRSIDGSRALNVVNCHLSGGAVPERRLRQVHEALDQIRKWKAKVAITLEKQRNARRPSPRNIAKAEDALRLHVEAGVIVCGDLNSDGDTGVRRLLVEGSVDPDWREPQYPKVPLTSKRKENSIVHSFVDAAELAYASNVCDGDYGESPSLGSRPATYVVPNLASMLLLPINGGGIPRTQFGYQVARGVADMLGLHTFSASEVKRAFKALDLDGNNVIDEDEVQMLVETVYFSTHGRMPTAEERTEFLRVFGISSTDRAELSYEQLTRKLAALKQELEGGSEGTELVEVRTEVDVQRMIARFTPLLRDALDCVFDRLSSDGGETLSEEDAEKFLVVANGQLGRGGMWRQTASLFEIKTAALMRAALTRQEWYEMFARELAEGKWWQVMYDLEVCGANLRSQAEEEGHHYQGWLDYVYFNSQRLACTGIQEALTAAEHSRIHDDRDALPNEWYPSDHLPVAALFCWK
mmetsp:Transcript_12417/g.36584  ORF Transcript_12417/g.36584 Transcript_12417/m.36584 type:complete len:660 (-) Transcript_12417:139-2118(-)